MIVLSQAILSRHPGVSRMSIIRFISNINICDLLYPLYLIYHKQPSEKEEHAYRQLAIRHEAMHFDIVTYCRACQDISLMESLNRCVAFSSESTTLTLVIKPVDESGTLA